MIYFIGAGPGAPDLITLRGAELLRRAGMIVYAGSLVNPALLDYAPQGCEVYDSALMTLDEVMEKLLDGERRGLTTVRLHTGDPSLYELLLRGGGGHSGGVHAARRQPDPHHQPHGGPDARPGARGHPLSGRPRGLHGAVPVERHAEGACQ